MPTKTVTINDFRGPMLRLEATDVPIKNALLALNCEYNPGNTGTRAGFGPALDIGADPLVPITSMYNWVRNADAAVTAGNALAYFTSGTHKAKIIVNLVTGTAYDIFTDASAYAATFASGGSRLYACGFSSAGLGTSQARVIGTDVAAIYIDKAFMGPITHKPTLTNTSTGSVTAGVHRVGYILQTRNGFMGKISPVDSVTRAFDTTSTITAPGGQKIGFSVNTTWPTEAAKVYPVMTTADNLAQYFLVPGMEFGVPGGQSYSYSVSLDISDTDLKNSSDVTDNLNLFTQDSSGNGPFNPFMILEFGPRVLYFTVLDGISRYYASDITSGIGVNPQAITADQHVRYLPGFRTITSGFVLDHVLYVLGPHWTYAQTDSLTVPVEWPTPELVDSQIGAMGPLATTVNSSKGMAWVADSSGLYVFSGGQYAARPVSYYDDPTWKRINLNAGYTVQVKDNKDKQQVYVLAPLDGATSPSHILMYDYSNGITAETVKPSIWNITDYDPGAIEVVQNQNTKRMELWTASTATHGKILRQQNWADDGNPHADDGAAIDWQFECALLPGMNADVGMVFRHLMEQIRAMGVGKLQMTVYSIDHKSSVQLPPIELGTAPGREYTRRLSMLSESVSILFTMESAAYNYCLLSALEHTFAKGPMFR